MASDRGVSPDLRAERARSGVVRGLHALHLPGYSLLRSPIDDAALRAAELAPRRLRRPLVLERDPRLRAGALPRAARGSSSRPSSSRTRTRSEILGGPIAGTRRWIVKRGPRGARFGDDELPARTAEVVDTTGAGDAFAAGYLVGGAELALERGGTLRRATRLDAVKDPISISDEVGHALADRRPVVALETTLVAHGFPPGEGVEVGLESERRVRDAGAVPATIGVLDGQLRVGLSEEELGRFTADARKVGPRDLAAAIVQGAVGATTVGGTLAACRAVGIGFMGTGGLGGVHRGFPDPPDVSADLGELIRTEALIVSSGVKSILDVPATAELLETLGVPVLGYRTDDLPLFYAAHGGPPVSARVESAAEAAQIAQAHWRLGRHTSILLGRPAEDSLDDVEPLIERALADAHEQGVAGQQVTPFVLAYLHRESGGRTLAANRELIAANARLAGEVAVAYAAL